jgi:sulfide:quinone oxidoreductase
MYIARIASKFSTHTKFCIIGGGTGGLNLSAHLLRKNIPATDIRIFDAAEKHYYQPGWTMVGGNLCKSDLTERNMKDVLPSDVLKTQENVTKVDP